MVDQVERLINDIAIKHGVVIGRDDPILILQTMNTKLMEDNTKAQQLMLNEYKEDLEEIALRWGNDAKEKSERILNASLTASKETMANVLEECTKNTVMAIKNNMEPLLSDMDKALHRTERVAMINLIASALTIISVSMLVFGIIR